MMKCRMNPQIITHYYSCKFCGAIYIDLIPFKRHKRTHNNNPAAENHQAPINLDVVESNHEDGENHQAPINLDVVENNHEDGENHQASLNLDVENGEELDMGMAEKKGEEGEMGMSEEHGEDSEVDMVEEDGETSEIDMSEKNDEETEMTIIEENGEDREEAEMAIIEENGEEAEVSMFEGNEEISHAMNSEEISLDGPAMSGDESTTHKSIGEEKKEINILEKNGEEVNEAVASKKTDEEESERITDEDIDEEHKSYEVNSSNSSNGNVEEEMETGILGSSAEITEFIPPKKISEEGNEEENLNSITDPTKMRNDSQTSGSEPSVDVEVHPANHIDEVPFSDRPPSAIPSICGEVEIEAEINPLSPNFVPPSSESEYFSAPEDVDVQHSSSDEIEPEVENNCNDTDDDSSFRITTKVIEATKRVIVTTVAETIVVKSCPTFQQASGSETPKVQFSQADELSSISNKMPKESLVATLTETEDVTDPLIASLESLGTVATPFKTSDISGDKSIEESPKSKLLDSYSANEDERCSSTSETEVVELTTNQTSQNETTAGNHVRIKREYLSTSDTILFGVDQNYTVSFPNTGETGNTPIRRVRPPVVQEEPPAENVQIPDSTPYNFRQRKSSHSLQGNQKKDLQEKEKKTSDNQKPTNIRKSASRTCSSPININKLLHKDQEKSEGVRTTKYYRFRIRSTSQTGKVQGSSRNASLDKTSTQKSTTVDDSLATLSNVEQDKATSRKRQLLEDDSIMPSDNKKSDPKLTPPATKRPRKASKSISAWATQTGRKKKRGSVGRVASKCSFCGLILDLKSSSICLPMKLKNCEVPLACQTCRGKYGEYKIVFKYPSLGETRYACSVCKADFKTRARLLSHFYTHTREKRVMVKEELVKDEICSTSTTKDTTLNTPSTSSGCIEPTQSLVETPRPIATSSPRSSKRKSVKNAVNHREVENGNDIFTPNNSGKVQSLRDRNKKVCYKV